MPINADLTCVLPDVRKVYNNASIFSGPMPKKNIEGALSELLERGVNTIVDFRGNKPDASDMLKAICSSSLFNIDYYKFPQEHIFEHPLKNFDSNNFVAGLKQFFNVMNRGNAYIGCEFGVHRTDMGIMYNFLLNPNAQNVPSILPWSKETSINDTIYMLVGIFKDTFEKLTEKQREDLKLFGSTADIYQKVFEEKLNQLCSKHISDYRSKTTLINNIAGKFLSKLPKI